MDFFQDLGTVIHIAIQLTEPAFFAPLQALFFDFDYARAHGRVTEKVLPDTESGAATG